VPTGAALASLIPVVAVVFICGLSDVLINEYFISTDSLVELRERPRENGTEREARKKKRKRGKERERENGQASRLTSSCLSELLVLTLDTPLKNPT